MTDRSEWQKANRELMAESRRALGDPPTAEEMLAYTRGELSENEEERVRDLLAAYPEVARLYGESFPAAPHAGEADYVADEQLAARFSALQERLDPSRDAQRGRVLFFRYVPTSIAAALALVFFGLFVQAELRARHYAQQATLPRLLGAAQELQPDGRRGPDTATILRKDGEVYLLEPHLINQPRYPHYRIALLDAKGTALWTSHTALPDEEHVFQITVPHALLRSGETYQLRIFGVDGESEKPLGRYDVRAPAE